MIDSAQLKVIYPDWPAPCNVRAFTTTRNDGFSKGPWKSLNLSDKCGDDPKDVEQNRQLLRKLLPADPLWLKQVHGKRVVRFSENVTNEPKADAVVSMGEGQVCGILHADCLPVLFCDKSGTKVAAAHAGWRGLVAGVLEATVCAMDCDPKELIVWLGPSIGSAAFEVGYDVYDAFLRIDKENACAFNDRGNSWWTDFYMLARLVLARTGVKMIIQSQFCTHTEKSKFFSYRRDNLTGRMASVIWLEEGIGV